MRARPDGTQVPCLFNATPFLDEHGTKVGSFAMVTDVTSRREMEEEDEEDPRAVGQFMRKMSHELGEDMGDEFNEVVDRLESGQAPDAIEQLYWRGS